MDSNNRGKNKQHTESRVQILQAAVPTGDVALTGTIDRNDRIKAIIQQMAQSGPFVEATIFLTIAAVPFVLIFPVCPWFWMVIGLWIIYAQAHKKNGEIGQAGFTFLMIGQYLGFGLSLVGAFVSFCLVVEGCTDLGQQYPNLQTALFWGSGFALLITFLLAGYYWKVVCAVRTIQESNAGFVSGATIPAGAIVECFVVGVLACSSVVALFVVGGAIGYLSIVGLFVGVASILFGCVLVCYNKAVAQIDADIQEQEMAKAERCVFLPTWKKIEGNAEN